MKGDGIYFSKAGRENLHRLGQEQSIIVSVSDPDRAGVSGFGIRIQIQAGKNDQFRGEKIRNFMFLKFWMFSLRAEGSSCSTDVLYGGLESRNIK